MGLAELLPQSYEFSFGEARISLRYDMTALLFLERCGLEYKDIFAESIRVCDLSVFVQAGFPAIGEKRAEKLIRAVGARKMWEHIQAAVLLSLPEPDPLVIPENKGGTGEIDFAVLRTLVCDIMKKDEDFFWKSTIRELVERWQNYAVAKGFRKPPERIQIYDTEGM